MKKSADNLNFDLNWGLRGLKISLYFLIGVLVFAFIFVIVNQDKFPGIFNNIFSLPNNSSDYLAIFAGAILFIAVPFSLGIKLGMLKSKGF